MKNVKNFNWNLWKKKHRPWQDSNLQSSDSKSDALSIRLHDPLITSLKMGKWWQICPQYTANVGASAPTRSIYTRDAERRVVCMCTHCTACCMPRSRMAVNSWPNSANIITVKGVGSLRHSLSNKVKRMRNLFHFFVETAVE